ncbi:enoyl-CoA hydratase/isomerase family protein [Bacillus taeanensis]|uniref:Enoyl-CoA hydratase/isomerase family protein n=1 Tax=Bacillus taeanensis TaxID=273032 RepID=A0A366XXI8_9BACI|nr:enoyl-CoA hydratase-related protein [Bacillus taeanensis]RBW71110.1 enoyl-CoA hydratase/isomerase family protein [Bacillus taeanensis]
MRITISRVETDGKITLQESGGMAIVTIHRPHLKNAMSSNMWRELGEIGKRIPQNPKTRIVIVRGSKGQFTAGSDLKEFNQMTVEEANEAFRLMEETISTFEKMPLPTIAAISGPALGAGFVLSLACDLRVGTSKAKMGIPVGRLGITLPQVFVRRIESLIDRGRMLDLVYTGRLLNAVESYQLGLINYMLSDDEDIDHYVIGLAKKIMGQSPASLLAVKRSVAYSNPIISLPWDTGVTRCVDPVDFPEGVRAFVEKRKPNFKRRG